MRLKRSMRSQSWGKMAWVALLGCLAYAPIACASSSTSSAPSSSPASPAPQLQEMGEVSLEPLADSKMQAAHPIVIPEDTIVRVLRGIMIQGERTALQAVFESTYKKVPALNDQETRFLAPKIAKALSQAKPNQHVSFRLVHASPLLAFRDTGGAGVGSSQPTPYGRETETSSGTLYAYGTSLYVTLTEYRHRPPKPDTVNMPNRRFEDTTGLDRYEVVFLPQEALRPETFKPKGFFTDDHLTTLVIDYQLLAKLPAVQLAPPAAKQPAQPAAQAAPATPATTSPSVPPAAAVQPGAATQPAGSAAEMQAVKDLLIKKDLELQELKEEMRAIKKQLAEQDAEKQKLKKKKKPAGPPAATATPPLNP